MTKRYDSDFVNPAKAMKPLILLVKYQIEDCNDQLQTARREMRLAEMFGMSNLI
jgi:hypothetical protein